MFLPPSKSPSESSNVISIFNYYISLSIISVSYSVSTLRESNWFSASLIFYRFRTSLITGTVAVSISELLSRQ